MTWILAWNLLNWTKTFVNGTCQLAENEMTLKIKELFSIQRKGDPKTQWSLSRKEQFNLGTWEDEKLV